MRAGVVQITKTARHAPGYRRVHTMKALRTLTALLWAAALAGTSAAAVSETPSLEYQVKASYLYNFVQFIDWPADVFNGEFRVCVLGVDRFGGALDALQAETAAGRAIRVLRFEQPSAAVGAQCHVLFVSRSSDSAQALQMLTAKGVLTVGEVPGFTAQGGIINLVERQGHIRFQVNVQAAQRAGLTVSSRLLQLALDNR